MEIQPLSIRISKIKTTCPFLNGRKTQVHFLLLLFFWRCRHSKYLQFHNAQSQIHEEPLATTVCTGLIVLGRESNYSKCFLSTSHTKNSAESMKMENIQDWQQKILSHDWPFKQELDLDAIRKETVLWNSWTYSLSVPAKTICREYIKP